jgi:hypothetical protein
MILPTNNDKSVVTDILTQLNDYKIENYREVLKDLIVNLYITLFPNIELQQHLKWELAELSDRTKTVIQERENLSAGLIKQYEDVFRSSGLDINSFSTILISGIHYLVLHKEHSTFCGLDINKENNRLPETLGKMIDIFFDALERHNRVIDIARKMKAKGFDIETISEITGLDIDQVKEPL